MIAKTTFNQVMEIGFTLQERESSVPFEIEGDVMYYSEDILWSTYNTYRQSGFVGNLESYVQLEMLFHLTKETSQEVKNDLYTQRKINEWHEQALIEGHSEKAELAYRTSIEHLSHTIQGIFSDMKDYVPAPLLESCESMERAMLSIVSKIYEEI